jgi:hypothetical protein
MENSAERREIDGVGAAPAPAEAEQAVRGPAADPGEHTVDERVRAVLAVLAGRSSSAREASALGVTEADIDRWKRQFVDAGSRGMLARGRTAAPPPSIADLTARNEALRSALRRANAEAGSWRRSAQGRWGPFIQIEEIRQRRGMPVERFCALIGVSRRTYFRSLALLSARARPRRRRDVRLSQRGLDRAIEIARRSQRAPG